MRKPMCSSQLQKHGILLKHTAENTTQTCRRSRPLKKTMTCILQNLAMLKLGLVCTECRGLGPTTPRALLDFGEVAAQITMVGINSAWSRILYMNGMTATVQTSFLSSAIKVTFYHCKYQHMGSFVIWHMFIILFSFKIEDHDQDEDSDWCRLNWSSY